MINYKEIIRLHIGGLKQREIAISCGCSRSTVERTVNKYKSMDLTWDSINSMTNESIGNLFYPKSAHGNYQYVKPDFKYVIAEMSKPGVTIQQCWLEYCEQCQAANLHAYQYSQFTRDYHDAIISSRATMHLEHKRGDIMQVDWTGTTLTIKNKLTGKEEKAYVFVAVLPYSGYTYAEAFMDMKEDSWITAHVNAYAYFGGVTRILVPDNLKTGVIKNTKYETVINPVYQEMAEHYGTAIIPARPRSPKDKAAVEGTVGNLTNNLIAPLRNNQYFSLVELNEDVFRLLDKYNNKPFQKKEGSRASLFEGERPYLLPLPRYSYEIASWKIAKVQFNYHVSVDGKYYSCPYEYIGKEVKVRISPKIVEIFYKGERIASHVRLGDAGGLYSTHDEHMPEDHRRYARWDGAKFRKWAKDYGDCTHTVVSYFLRSPKVEEQGFKSCMALLNLSSKYTKDEIEDACAICLKLTRNPSLKSIVLILEASKKDTQKTISNYGIVRGPEYYMRKGDE